MLWQTGVPIPENVNASFRGLPIKLLGFRVFVLYLSSGLGQETAKQLCGFQVKLPSASV